MLYREIFRIVGYFLLLFSICLIVPIGIAYYYEYNGSILDNPQLQTADDFILTFMICLLLSAYFLLIAKGATGTLYRREGIAAVVLIWILAPAISATPFLSSGTLKDPIKAYFEMVSGFTTTGSTVLHAKKYNDEGKEIPIVFQVPGVIDTAYNFYGTVKPIRDPVTGKIVREGIEAVGKSLLFWRSFTQWLGGIGIVVLLVAILPALGAGGKVLFQSEIGGPVKEGSAPRIKETALQLLKIYVGLTVVQIATLVFVDPNLPLFEAIAISLSTISTGGFSTQNTSLAGYDNINIEWVIIVFMILGAINFALYSYIFKGKFYRLWDRELIFFIILIAAFSAIIVSTIYGKMEISVAGVKEGIFDRDSSFRDGLFQLVSAITTTGFSTTDYNAWPYASQVILLIAMFVGGMSGSTAGGIKVIRNYMLFRIAQYRVESLFRPDHVRIFKLGEREVDSGAAITVLCFFLIVVSVATLGTTLYVFDGLDLETAMSLSACMQNNTGMSFRIAGPQFSCAFLSDFSLIVATLQMLFGRLEYYAILAMLVPAFWQKEG